MNLLDERGRVKGIIDYKGREISYQWGKFGERKIIQYPNGHQVKYEYDQMGRIERLIDGEKRIEYHYDAEGRLAEKIFSDGLGSYYEYNQMGFLTDLVHQIDGKIIEEYHYKYDLMGNKIEIERYHTLSDEMREFPDKLVKKIKEDQGIYKYSYDRLNRLTKVIHNKELVKCYQYDAFGNRVQTEENNNKMRYYYNAANQLLKTESRNGVEHYYYDKRGNLIEIIRKKQVINHYSYDVSNRLTEAENETGQKVCYQYNGLGDRISRKVFLQTYKVDPILMEMISCSNDDRIIKKLIKEEDYLLDLTKRYFNLLEKLEKSDGNETIQRYTWDTNAVYVTEGKDVFTFLQDDLGSTIRLVDLQKNQQVIYGYDEFGNDFYGNSGEIQPFGYTGYQKDNISNTYFAQMREYLPQIGRFGGEDRIKGITHSPFTQNQYGYCWGNPLNLVDLDGKIPDFKQIFCDFGDEAIEKIKEEVYKISETEITNAEAMLIMNWPTHAYTVFKCGKSAEEWTNKIFKDYYHDVGDGLPPHWQDGDIANAYRHAMWNGLLTKRIGRNWAKIFTDAHEAWPKEVLQMPHGGGFTRQEHTDMDFYNNAVGRSCVQWYESLISDQEISDRIVEKLREGELVYIVDDHWYDGFMECPSTQ